MWAGPKKGDKIGDRIREEAGLDKARFSGLGRPGMNMVSQVMEQHSNPLLSELS